MLLACAILLDSGHCFKRHRTDLNDKLLLAFYCYFWVLLNQYGLDTLDTLNLQLAADSGLLSFANLTSIHRK